MKNEVYLWALILIVIVSVALYYRYLYQPAISIALGMNSSTLVGLYPYQKVATTINIFNNGSSVISNMSLGILINNNLSTLYKITLPVGKQTAINYNYSPTLPGTYTISAVVDPLKVYNIADRSKARANVSFKVNAAQTAEPSELLLAKNISSLHGENMTRGGYAISAYLSTKYNMSRFSLTDNAKLNRFLSPVLNLTFNYIHNISIADAKYSDNSSAYSVWLQGYLSPSIFSTAAAAAGLNWSNVSTKGGSVTFARLANDTTFCSWYSGGWLKTLSYSGHGANCADLLNRNGSNATAVGRGISSNFYAKLSTPNSTILGSYSGVSDGSAYAARLSLLNSTSFIYASISNNTPQNSICFGIINIENGTYYCSAYLLPISGGIMNFSLIETTAYVKTYNLTALSLVNTSLILKQVPVAIDLIKGFNVTGNSLVLTSGIVNTCSFSSTPIGCENLKYSNGTVSFRIINEMSSAIKLNSVECYTLGSIIGTPLNTTLKSAESLNMSTTCHGLSNEQAELMIGLNLKLALNYSVANTTHVAIGSVFIPFG